MKGTTEAWAISGYAGVLKAYEFTGTPLEAAFAYAWAVRGWEKSLDLWPSEEPILYRAVTVRREVGA